MLTVALELVWSEREAFIAALGVPVEAPGVLADALCLGLRGDGVRANHRDRLEMAGRPRVNAGHLVARSDLDHVRPVG